MLFYFAERFYLDALETIDKAVGLRLTEIDRTVRWKDKFKVCF